MDDGGEMEGAEASMEEGMSDDSAKTVLVDSSLCPGMKPGDEFTVRVEKVLDSGEYSLSYTGDSEKTEPEMEPTMEEEMAPESEAPSYMA